ncbi:luciferase-like protein [Coleophoma crateriformis]|uniref:Luciferase-like protein n=1 Tax=Coleophoma crateriformis TaxID=565419 RepID=A0A3D8TBC4_9HELO|nr:luciferase-like protein [Coleophoma crateriformis]
MAEGSATPSRPKKIMQLNFFETACTGSHMATGQWKSPEDNSRYKDRLDYYIWLARLAEKGKITSIFFADTYGIHETYQGSPAATYRGGSQVGTMDPVCIVSAMAAVTKTVAFGITGSTSYINPFILARTWSTLDHLTRGRISWNVVTSYSNSAARCMGKDKVLPSEERYKAAHEYMDLVYQLWEDCWDDGAQKWSVEPECAYDPDMIHRVEYNGKYHKMSGYGQVHPSPQRTPVIFQAGASKSGIEFAGKHAEGIYTDVSTVDAMLSYTKAVRAAAARNGRDPSSIKFFAAIMPIIGRTVEEAQAKYDYALKNISVQGGLAKFSSYTNVDMSQFPLDEPFNFEGKTADNTITGVINNFKTYSKDMSEAWTPRKLGGMLSFGGTTPMPVGTPSMVADFMEKWFTETDIDGFNMAYVSNPGSFEDVVELLVPELQKRGLMWTEYPVPGGTFRENVQCAPGQCFLPANHPAKSKFERPNYLEEERAAEEKKKLEAQAEKLKEATAIENDEGKSSAAKEQVSAVTPKETQDGEEAASLPELVSPISETPTLLAEEPESMKVKGEAESKLVEQLGVLNVDTLAQNNEYKAEELKKTETEVQVLPVVVAT